MILMKRIELLAGFCENYHYTKQIKYGIRSVIAEIFRERIISIIRIVYESLFRHGVISRGLMIF